MGELSSSNDEKLPILETTELEDGKTQTGTGSEKRTTLFNTFKGLVYAAIHTFGMGASSVAVPLLERKIPDFELNSYRSGLTLIIIIISLLVTKQLPRIPKEEIIGLSVFSCLSFVATVTSYTAVSMVPLSYFKSLLLSVNIICGLVLFPLCLNEKTGLRAVALAVMCVVGVICSIQPDFIFTWKKNKMEENLDLAKSNSTSDFLTYTQDHPYFTTIGIILSAITGLLDTLQILTLKKRPFIGKNLLQCLFWILSMNVVLSLTAMTIFEKPVWPETSMQFLLIAIHSFSFSLVYCFMMLATKYISGNAFNIIYSFLVIIMLIPQYTLLKHILPGNRNWIEVLGTVLVFTGATAGSIWELIHSSNKIQDT